ncbi:MAG TPA: hypothetical protein VKT82_20685 [Ktedonobacterales bacterium]|nr:hypothetical protein [Ktedonobacterales bacterium]
MSLAALAPDPPLDAPLMMIAIAALMMPFPRALVCHRTHDKKGSAGIWRADP